MWKIGKRKTSGTHTWYILTADDEKELSNAARILRVNIHGKGRQEKHLDLTEHKAHLAVRHGAIQDNDE